MTNATNLRAMSIPLLNRLVCAKHLFIQGVEALDRRGPYAAGTAVLAFQDALELLLRTIAEHIGAPVKDKSAFNQLLDDIEKQTGSTLPFRSAMLQMNQARVSFKHLGLEPRDEDVRKFRVDLEGFFPLVCKSLADVNYHELSLAKLIVNSRTRNWIEKAYARFESGDFEDAIEAAAVSFEIFNCAHKSAKRVPDLEGLLRKEMESRNAPMVPNVLPDILREIQAQFEEIRGRIDFVSAGLDADASRRFVDLAPIVHLSSARTIHIGQKHYGAKSDYSSALFCLSYVVDAALKLQHAYRPDPHAQIPLKRRFRVITPTSVIVYPEDESKETIADVKVGDLLVGYYEKYDKPGYIALFYDNDRAYVSSGCVERTDSNAENAAT